MWWIRAPQSRKHGFQLLDSSPNTYILSEKLWNRMFFTTIPSVYAVMIPIAPSIVSVLSADFPTISAPNTPTDAKGLLSCV